MISSPCSTLSRSEATNRSTSGASPPMSIENVVADRCVQDVLQRRGIGNRRHRSVVEAAIQQQPRIAALGVRRRERSRRTRSGWHR